MNYQELCRASHLRVEVAMALANIWLVGLSRVILLRTCCSRGTPFSNISSRQWGRSELSQGDGQLQFLLTEEVWLTHVGSFQCCLCSVVRCLFISSVFISASWHCDAVQNLTSILFSIYLLSWIYCCGLSGIHEDCLPVSVSPSEWDLTLRT